MYCIQLKVEGGGGSSTKAELCSLTLSNAPATAVNLLRPVPVKSLAQVRVGRCKARLLGREVRIWPKRWKPSHPIPGLVCPLTHLPATYPTPPLLHPSELLVLATLGWHKFTIPEQCRDWIWHSHTTPGKLLEEVQMCLMAGTRDSGLCSLFIQPLIRWYGVGNYQGLLKWPSIIQIFLRHSSS